MRAKAEKEKLFSMVPLVLIETVNSGTPQQKHSRQTTDTIEISPEMPLFTIEGLAAMNKNERVKILGFHPSVPMVAFYSYFLDPTVSMEAFETSYVLIGWCH